MTDDIRNLARRSSEEIWFSSRPSAVDAYYADDFEWQTPMPGMSADRAGYRQFVEQYLGAFDDVTGNTLRIVVEGDTAVIHWLTSARHTGELMGIPATGRNVQWTGVTVQRYSDGKVTEEWSYPDAMALMGQLGALPQMARAGSR